MDQVLNVLLGLSYVVGPLSLAAMVYVGWRLIRDNQQKRRERP